LAPRLHRHNRSRLCGNKPTPRRAGLSERVAGGGLCGPFAFCGSASSPPARIPSPSASPSASCVAFGPSASSASSASQRRQRVQRRGTQRQFERTRRARRGHASIPDSSRPRLAAAVPEVAMSVRVSGSPLAAILIVAGCSQSGERSIRLGRRSHDRASCRRQSGDRNGCSTFGPGAEGLIGSTPSPMPAIARSSSRCTRRSIPAAPEATRE
jgi:hypothetical protein